MKTLKNTIIYSFVMLALQLLLGVNSASADLSWLYEASSCEELSTGITKHFSQARSEPSNQDKTKIELRLVLFEGCGPRFRNCKLTVCEHADKLEKDEQRPLFWIDRVSNCKEFRNEFKQRYAFVKTSKQLSPEIRSELDYIFLRACSKSFGDCGLRQCGETPDSSESNSVGPSINQATAPEPETEIELAESDVSKEVQLARQKFSVAMSHYDRLVSEENQQRKAAIEIKLAEEESGSLAWVTAANPEEQDTLRQRQREKKETKNVDSGPNNLIRSTPPRNKRQPVKRRIPVNTGTSAPGPLVY